MLPCGLLHPLLHILITKSQIAGFSLTIQAVSTTLIYLIRSRFALITTLAVSLLVIATINLHASPMAHPQTLWRFWLFQGHLIPLNNKNPNKTRVFLTAFPNQC